MVHQYIKQANFRGRQSRRKPKRPTSRGIAASSCRSLILVDSERLKNEEQKKCKNALGRLDALKQSLENHESQDLPEYRRWLNLTFGAELTQIREMNQKLNELHELIESVHEHSEMTGSTLWKSYEVVTGLRAKRDALIRDPGADAGEGPQGESNQEPNEEKKEDYTRSLFEAYFGNERQWKARQKRNPFSTDETYEEAYQAFRKQFDGPGGNRDFREDDTEDFDPFSEFMGDFERDPEDGFRDFFGGSSHRDHIRDQAPNHAPGPDADQWARIKELYRMLARKLHPDLNPGLAPKYLELWHEVQSAYESKDLDRLETLCAMGDLHFQDWDQKGKSENSLYLIKKILKELNSAIRQIQKKIKQAKNDPSWEFIKKKTDIKLFRKLMSEHRTEFEITIEENRDELDQLKSVIRSWENREKPRKQKRRGRHRDFGFSPEFMDDELSF